MAVTPHSILEVRSATGDLIWRFDRDGPKPRRVMPQSVAADINMILNKAVEEGTGKRSMVDGVSSAGKTGTTNAYRDAWFAGYTGNMVAAVWFGNDDYAPTNRMTGGSLPAMTWKKIMAYAHQGVELKQMPGAPPSPAPVGPQRCSRTWREAGRRNPASCPADTPRRRRSGSHRTCAGRRKPRAR